MGAGSRCLLARGTFRKFERRFISVTLRALFAQVDVESSFLMLGKYKCTLESNDDLGVCLT